MTLLDPRATQAAERSTDPPTPADRAGQAWTSYRTPFLVVGCPRPVPIAPRTTFRLHPIVWLRSEGSVEAGQLDTMPEFAGRPWETCAYMERM